MICVGFSLSSFKLETRNFYYSWWGVQQNSSNRKLLRKEPGIQDLKKPGSKEIQGICIWNHLPSIHDPLFFLLFLPGAISFGFFQETQIFLEY